MSRKPCKAYHIDASARTITEVEYISLEGLQNLVGGYIEAAYSWPNGDHLFVDEEGLLKDPQTFFAISERPDQMLAGNGVLVGDECDDFGNSHPPTMTIEGLRQRVIFAGASATDGINGNGS